MDYEKNKRKMDNSSLDEEYPVQRMNVKGKVTSEDVKESVEEMNPDENTLDRG